MEKKLLMQDLADALSAREGLTKKKSEAFVKALFETIEEGLLADKFVKIKGLGTFKIVSVGERESVNINTGERFSISGHEKVTFTPDTTLKDLINRPFSHFQTVILNEDTDLEELDNVEDEPLEDDDFEERETENEEVEEDAEDKVPDNFIDSNSDKQVTPPKAMEDNRVVSQDEALLYQSSEESPGLSPQKSEDSPLEEAATELSATTSSATETEPTETNEVIPAEESGKIPSDGDEASAEEGVPTTVAEAIRQETQETADAGNPLKNSSVETNDTRNQENTQAEQNDKTSETKRSSETEEKDSPANDHDFPSSTALNDDTNVTQKKEAQTESIKYIIKESESKTNVWKNIAITLFVILVLILVYFAGYFKLFCPCELASNQPQSPIQTTVLDTNVAPSPKVEEEKGIQPDTTATENEEVSLAEEEQPVVTQPEAKKAEVKKAEMTPVKTQTPKKGKAEEKKTNRKNEKPKVEPQPKVEVKPEPTNAPVSKKEEPKEKTYPQIKNGNYRITGVLKKYVVQSGETIRSIALDVYGSKGYANYIVVLNHLTNPDNINAGTEILLPKLESNQKKGKP